MLNKIFEREAARRALTHVGTDAKARRGRRRPARPQVFRPAVELLEDRRAPAIITSNGDIQMIAPPRQPAVGPPSDRHRTPQPQRRLPVH